VYLFTVAMRDVANRGEDRSFHIMEGSVPIWTTGLVR